MATEKQIAANGHNAKKSTGPRTSEGKARAARNSFKHGLLAKPALLPDEDRRAFREFMEERIRDLDPVGPVESDLAEQIAFQLWRLNRFPRVEAGLFIRDRAERDQTHFQNRMGQFETREPSRMERMHESMTDMYRPGKTEITDEVRHAEAEQRLSAAREVERSEPALLASAFSSAAVNGDPFGSSVATKLLHSTGSPACTPTSPNCRPGAPASENRLLRDGSLAVGRRRACNRRPS